MCLFVISVFFLNDWNVFISDVQGEIKIKKETVNDLEFGHKAKVGQLHEETHQRKQKENTAVINRQSKRCDRNEVMGMNQWTDQGP